MVSELPQGWAETTIGEICVMGPKSAWDDGMEIGFVPMSHAPTNFRDQLNYDSRPWHEVKKAYTHFENGDVIFAKVTPCFENGKAALVAGLPNSAGAGSSEFHVLRGCDAGISPSYLLAVIKSAQFLREGEENMTGAVGLRRVPRAFVENFPVRLPPEAEQKRIAQKLDALLAQVETLKARIDAIPALLKRFRQCVLQAASTGDLTASWATKEGASKWINLRFRELLRDFRGGASIRPSGETHGTPVLRSSAVRPMLVNFEDVSHFDKSMTLNPNDYAMQGDLLFTRLSGSAEFVGVCGRVKATPRVPTQFPDRLFCARLINSRYAPYLEIFFSSQNYISYIGRNLKSSAGHQRITTETVKNAEIRLPSLEEQIEIVRRVEQLFAYADQLEAKVVAAQKRIDALTQSLLAKAFRGELVPQDPSDEPASALLERIRAQRAASPKPKRGRKAATS
ncbi:TPA: type I restriction endonuclease subunit S [Xanthomonas vasicola pv. zeae]|uniref:Type I restriction endonuclease subunit S n=3 Tax=Xanthomonas vasicola TaxID=56459 RepID=A0AAE8F9Y3_XANVA|nr:restriction endonuclease subunit S [Xanthomonas vasicola]AVQ06253.1 type I restriction endonuclease subunit S [Xanthomonas vasicola pv. vasculorum]AZM70453.1 type I restriction endonuclease subunit S [Xanthomonas vasicola pv. vasculorum]MDO6957169.1 restriction endonuclease subunit S [Xanthomonas vasicola]MDO6974234.1 restriction endonuclease subunit S [Xanthomonas vasicola]OWF58782.1 type I restriction endonuclease subunit S [Xanthomonas vasicola pv. vasculorum]